MKNLKEIVLKKALVLGTDGINSIVIDTIFGEFRIEGEDLKWMLDMVGSVIDTNGTTKTEKNIEF